MTVDRDAASRYLNERRANQAAARAAIAAETDTRATLGAITDCGLCDDDGYTASLQVCNHLEHSTPEGRAAAMAIVRAALNGAGE